MLEEGKARSAKGAPARVLWGMLVGRASVRERRGGQVVSFFFGEKM